MNRIDQLIEELCPEGVEYRLIKDVVRNVVAPKKIKREHYNLQGWYPIVDQSKSMIAGYTDDADAVIHTSRYVVFGEHTCAVKYVDFEFAQGADGLKILLPMKFVDARYLFHSVSNIRIPSRGYNRHWPVLKDLPIPIPPLEIQREIVKILDAFTKLEAELEAELEARMTQYAYYRDTLLNFDGREDVRWATLGEVGEVSMCKRVFKNETSESGDIPFFKIGTFGGSPDAYISRQLFEEYRSRYSYPKKGDILISAAGTIGRAIPFDGAESYFQDSNIVWIDNNEALVTNTFLLHWYRIVKWSTEGGTVQRLYNSNLRKTAIPIPPLAEQERIVGILDSFDALVNDLSSGLPAEIAARRKQYEHYRDRLLTFRERGVGITQGNE
jgi:type I restriction enzyme S subunit